MNIRYEHNLSCALTWILISIAQFKLVAAVGRVHARICLKTIAILGLLFIVIVKEGTRVVRIQLVRFCIIQ